MCWEGFRGVGVQELYGQRVMVAWPRVVAVGEKGMELEHVLDEYLLKEWKESSWPHRVSSSQRAEHRKGRGNFVAQRPYEHTSAA